MEVVVCQSGAAALQQIRAERYDLVFMDHMMPEMDGMEVVAKIREWGGEDPYYAMLPIVALTANAVSGTKEMFLANGFNDFLSKPIDAVRLNSILEQWLPKEKQIDGAGESMEAEGRQEEESQGERVQGESQAVSQGEGVQGESQSEDGDGSLTIDRLDTRKGIALMGGSIPNYLKTLAVFHKDALEKMQEMSLSLETGDIPLYTIYVHALKSAAVSIGADSLADAAQGLEMAGKRGDAEFIYSHNEGFFQDLRGLLPAIQTAVTEVREGGQAGDTDREALKAALAGLREALDAFDSAQIKKAVSNLQRFSEMADMGDNVGDILQNVLIGEYEAAMALSELCMLES
jgi:CheY-like chemotaxis protein